MKRFQLWLIPALVLMLASANGQNNAIFNGGTEDGNSSIRRSTATQNSIFQGALEDGYANNRQSTESNSGIFSGGIDDGYASARQGTTTNNGIFSGGINDGYDKLSANTPSNNGIFSGGIEDGYALERSATTSNNGVFSGGIEDGFASRRSDIIDNNPQLPIELLYFTAREFGNEVLTSWETASEWNNDYFTVEKSKNTFDIEELGRLASQGNSSDIQFYEMPDPSPFPGTSYYRLRQTDLDGTETWSDWVAVNFADSEIVSNHGLRVVPNPVISDEFEIEITGFQDEGMVEILMIDMKGRTVYWEQLEIPGLEIYRHGIIPGIDLATANYIMVVRGDKKQANAMVFIAR